LSTKILAVLPKAKLDEIERCTQGGCTVLMTLGPLPDCQLVQLSLREREGQMTVIASLGTFKHEPRVV
jgi:hypothetical protein